MIKSINRLNTLFDLRSVFCFLTVGGTSALVNLGSFTFTWHYFQWPNAASVTLAYFLAGVVHFTGNRYITFKEHKQQGLWQNLKKYLVMVLVNYLINLAIVQAAVEWFNIYPPLAVCIAIIATIGVGFVMSKLWVFKQQSLLEV